MSSSKKPLSLLLISALYILQGALSSINILTNLDNFPFLYIRSGISILYILIGLGLWSCRPRWHAFTVGITTFGIFFLPLVAVILIFMLSVMGLDDDFTNTLGPLILISLATMVIKWIYLLWQQSVLNRPDVLRLYRR